MNSINGMQLVDGYANYPGGSTDTDDAYDCCVLCLQTTGCGASGFDVSGLCFLFDNSGTCNGAEQDVEISTGDGGDLSLTVSNSNCGSAYYDGE